ncbi:hypothetical protein HGRIS_001052 [Hohenbuehelia grisea]|uniref:Uncharacterized protein n=1 Tax=Hohenbuehelia grisea TaxID=104357 RepID=A0ABR3JPD6_9AGAR
MHGGDMVEQLWMDSEESSKSLHLWRINRRTVVVSDYSNKLPGPTLRFASPRGMRAIDERLTLLLTSTTTIPPRPSLHCILLLSKRMAAALGGTVTNGIQDISALLPLLGTEQCETHVGSALVDGYLYAAFAPLSLFGSLGIVRAGGKALIACIRIRTFMGARLMQHAGFEPVGKALSQIMWEGDCHVAEKQLTETLEKLHITDVKQLSVKEIKRRAWNLWMLFWSLFAVIASMMPYIYFIRNDHAESKLIRWLYPAGRSIGSFLTAVMVQFIIQKRLTEIIKRRLLFLKLDDIVKQHTNIEPPSWWDAKYSSEVALCRLAKANQPPTWWEKTLRALSVPKTKQQILNAEEDDKKADNLAKELAPELAKELEKELKGLPKVQDELKKAQDNLKEAQDELKGELQHTLQELNRSVLAQKYEGPLATPIRWIYIICTIFGMALSIWGYVASFTIVTNDRTANSNSKGPLIWLGTEIALSLLRMLIWSLNPLFDETTHLAFTLELDAGYPLPTCNKFSEVLEEERVIPLVRSREFLGQITSFVGLLEPLESAGEGVTLYYTMSGQRQSQKRVLYITICDYTENISRTLLYLPDTDEPTSYITKMIVKDSDDDVEGDNAGRVQARLVRKTTMASNHITKDKAFVEKLKKHCASIFSKLNERRNGNNPDQEIKMTWALTLARNDKSQPNHIVNITLSPDELAYIRVGELERSKQAFCSARSEWVVQRIPDMSANLEVHVGTSAASTWPAYLLLYEWQFLERILVYESRELEIILLSSTKTMLSRLQQRPGTGRDQKDLEKEQKYRAVRRVKEEMQRVHDRFKKLLTDDSEALKLVLKKWEHLLRDIENPPQNLNDDPDFFGRNDSLIAHWTDSIGADAGGTAKLEELKRRLRTELDVMWKQLFVFVPAVQVSVEHADVLAAYEDVFNARWCNDSVSRGLEHNDISV